MSRAARRMARRARLAATSRSDVDPRRPPAKADTAPSELAPPPAARPREGVTAPNPVAASPESDPGPPAADVSGEPATDASTSAFGAGAPSAVSVDALDARMLPIVRALAGVARDTGSAAGRLERALDLLFTACAGGDPELPALVLDAWQCARHDKQVRLRLAWQHEQLRLALQDILAEGAVRGELRPGIDAAAVAGVMVDAAEGCLLQSVTESGAIGAAELARTLLSLALRGA